MPNDFVAGKRVTITGITGFKGTWLAAWLRHHGAHVSGLDIRRQEFFDSVHPDLDWAECDVRDATALRARLEEFAPEILFHLAAQPIVSIGYRQPVETFHTNVMGTVHVLEAARSIPSLRSLVVVTSDKCYRNTGERTQAFSESDALGGSDPYAASKSAQEMVVQSWSASFFGMGGAAGSAGSGGTTGVRVASARAGNTIGGGDWAADRLVPDIVRAAGRHEDVTLRHPDSVRPWQHVLDPIAGYVLLAEKLWRGDAASAYNFGPPPEDRVTVGELTAQLVEALGQGTGVRHVAGTFAESAVLVLDSSRARADLGWAPRLDTRAAIRWTADWYGAYLRREDVGACTRSQIAGYGDADR